MREEHFLNSQLQQDTFCNWQQSIVFRGNRNVAHKYRFYQSTRLTFDPVELHAPHHQWSL